MAFRIPQKLRRRRNWARDIAIPGLSGLALGAVIFIALSARAAAPQAEPAPVAVETVRVRVIDGDTVENLATGERIRLPNIDAPETGDRAQCAAERDAADRATRHARGLVQGAPVALTSTGRSDVFGRRLAYVSIDGRDLGALMMEAGLARPWRGRREPWCAADGSLLRAY